MIEAHGLTRRYGEFTAVRGISFSVSDGEILGMLGPNGAGKTTTIRMITGFLPPTSGQVTVNGHDLFNEPSRARREIGYLPETVALYGEMRVHEYLAYRTRLEGMSRAAAREAMPRTIRSCLLEDVEHQIIGTLSKGYRQRVGLAAAILHGPRVLVLDEPTVGLDPKQIIAIRELIRELGQERTLLISTHILPEVEQLCHRVLIIDRGRIVAEGTPQELRAQAQGSSIVAITVQGAPAGAVEALGRIPGVESVETVEAEADGDLRLRIESAPGEDSREAVFRAAVEHGWVLLELVERRESLEDIFVRLTGRDADAEEPEAEDSEEPEAEDSEEPISGDETSEGDQP
ncbi:MAG: ATP-binding cassette domain-containing protein [bacterium]|nr:ATP-binding cassette domain-containing protein [bacterium]